MAKLHAYLNFNGNCKDAFDFYQTVFKTESLGTQYYDDMPSEPSQPALPEEAKGKVMHTAIYLNQESMLMGSDIIDGFCSNEEDSSNNPAPLTFGNSNYIMLDAQSAQEARELFNGLSKDAKLIEMELEETFFAELFSSFQDKFGVSWMIHFEGNKKMG